MKLPVIATIFWFCTILFLKEGYAGIRAPTTPEKWGVYLNWLWNGNRNPIPLDKIEMETCVLKQPLHGEIPEDFDSRKHWKHCPSLWSIRDQGNCNSWGSAIGSLLSDHICISSNGNDQVEISEQYIFSCAVNFPENDCRGKTFNIKNVLRRINEIGAVSGGQYHSFKGCHPFSAHPCDHQHGCSDTKTTFKPTNCSLQTCWNSRIFTKSFQTDIRHVDHFCQIKSESSLRELTLRQKEETIQAEIMSNGPVLASINVNESFRTYDPNKQEIFELPSPDDHEELDTGEHWVKLVGWGRLRQCNGKEIDYWLVANSFGRSWGNGGFFRLRRGDELDAGVTRHVYSARISKNPKFSNYVRDS